MKRFFMFLFIVLTLSSLATAQTNKFGYNALSDASGFLHNEINLTQVNVNNSQFLRGLTPQQVADLANVTTTPIGSEGQTQRWNDGAWENTSTLTVADDGEVGINGFFNFDLTDNTAYSGFIRSGADEYLEIDTLDGQEVAYWMNFGLGSMYLGWGASEGQTPFFIQDGWFTGDSQMRTSWNGIMGIDEFGWTGVGNYSFDGNLNMKDNRIRNVTDPLEDQDAATKKYVDDNGATPAGNDTQIQYNNNGSFGASSGFKWNAGDTSINFINQSSTFDIGVNDKAKANFDYAYYDTNTNGHWFTGAQVVVPAGTEDLPGITFPGNQADGKDGNTGIYRVSENQIGISAGGVSLIWTGIDLMLPRPFSTVQIAGTSISASNPGFQITGGGSHIAGMFRDNDGTSNLRFGTKDLDRLSINSEGDISMGHDSVSAKTPQLSILGYPSGESLQQVSMGMSSVDGQFLFSGVTDVDEFAFDKDVNISGNVTLDGNIKANIGNFTNVTIGDPYNIYEQDGNIYIYNDTMGGTLFVNKLVVTNPDSIDIGGENFATLSVFNITIGNRSRRGISSNRDLGQDYSVNGTAIMGAINRNTNSMASLTDTSINALGHAIARIKYGPNYMYPEIGYFINNFGEMSLTNRNNGADNITIGFYDGVLRNSFADILEIVNNTAVINIENSNASDIYRTTFNYNVSMQKVLKFAFGQTIDNLVDGWLRITGNLNVTGNITGNDYSGEMWFDMDGNSTIPIISTNVWENVTGFTDEDNNGFTKVGDHLVANVAGKYYSTYSVYYDDGANVEFNYALAVNNVVQNKTRSHSKLGTANDITGSNGQGFLHLNIGDIINIQVVNIINTADPNLHHAIVNLQRIGN